MEAKVLMTRLKKVIDHLISDHQCTYWRRWGSENKWRMWVLENVSVLVNGPPTNQFRMMRGLPFHVMMKEAEDNVIPGSSISHLQVVDDTIIFLEAKLDYNHNLKILLSCLELFIGLGINYSKSVLIGIGIGDNVSNSLADAFGCCLGLFPLKYLGIPLGISPRKRVVWIKAADHKLLVMESAWWDCPLLCFSATPVKAVRYLLDASSSRFSQV
ncbi:LINE-1 reverse transcriptase isogeny [Gossypium australe]|uniref:LINE-1 reverse transcriptase isogeny n=1 Tax=Gossypium australe TaxID=47621 RepID=A0A5B6UYZ4_9ROSI|nr:LINE-1 reverse transcriptase isogeny [Gossypium australe]